MKRLSLSLLVILLCGWTPSYDPREYAREGDDEMYHPTMCDDTEWTECDCTDDEMTIQLRVVHTKQERESAQYN